MDLATLLMRVDERRYQTVTAWLADLELIVTATQQVRQALPADCAADFTIRAYLPSPAGARSCMSFVILNNGLRQ